MFKYLVICIVAISLVACNNEGSVTEEKIDSLNERIDTTLDKAWDSTKAKAKELRDKVKEELSEKKDSVRKDSINN